MSVKRNVTVPDGRTTTRPYDTHEHARRRSITHPQLRPSKHATRAPTSAPRVVVRVGLEPAIVPDQCWALLGLLGNGDVSWSARMLASHSS